VALALSCVLAAGAYVAWAATRNEATGAPAGSADTKLPAASRSAATPTVVFQHVGRDQGYAHVAVGTPGGERKFTPLVCERAYFTRETGLCLKSRQAIAQQKYDAMVVDKDFKVRHKVALPGLLNRARLSPDGRYGAATSFVVGHSYADDDASTHTAIIDMGSGKKLVDLEDFDVSRDGRVVKAEDRNFWGVTFSAEDSDRFYATMRTGGRTYLIEGSVRDRTAKTLHENVECPSLSPDETRIAYKKRVDASGVFWRFHVLDLETMKETPLAETRAIDDQAEWLDDDTVIYGLDASVWAVPAAGGGAPEELLPDALSPAVLRGSAS
jgi:hypothetical protein